MKREEQIIETAKEYYNPKNGSPYSLQMRTGFITGAKWADETMKDKMVKWLETINFEKDYIDRADYGGCFFKEEYFINDFIKAMEE